MRALFALWLVCVGGLMSPPGWAQDATPPDVRMIFDVSGSMKANDPANLRASALQLAAALLPSQARGSVWTFGSRVRNPLPDGKVDAQWRRRARSLAPQLADYQQFTDIEQALREATRATGGKRHVILLTDGMIDLPGGGEATPSPEAASRQTLINALAPVLADRGVVVHTIALSNNADHELLERVSQSTGGLAAVAETPEDLLRAFLDVLERIVPSDRVPLENGEFAIDPEIDGFNALLFHDQDAQGPILVGPDGERYTRDDHPDDILWQSMPRYDLIRVPEPDAGTWHIEGQVGDDSRVSVESPLTLRTKAMPTSLYLGFDIPLEAWLSRQGETLVGDAMPEGMRMRAELRDLDDATLSSTTLTAGENGHFTGTLPAPEQEGNARLVVTAEGPTRVRERVQGVNVISPLAISLNDDATTVILEAQHPRLDADNTRVSSSVLGESLDVEPVGPKTWHIALPELDPHQSVPLELSLEVTLDGRTRSIRLPALRLNPDARIGLAGADVDGDVLRTQALPKADEGPATNSVEPRERNLSDMAQTLWHKAGDEWQALKPHVAPYAKRPTTWAALAALLLAVVALSVMRRRARRRRRRRREPHV